MMTAERLASIRERVASDNLHLRHQLAGEASELLSLLDGPVREVLMDSQDGTGVAEEWNLWAGQWVKRCRSCWKTENCGVVSHAPNCQWERREAILALLTPLGEAGEVG